MLTLGTLAEALLGHPVAGLDQVVTDAAIDSRLVIPGALFVAIPGGKTDGHDFVDEAFGRGAVAALVEREMPESLHVLDLRPGASLPPTLGDGPICLRVEQTVEALQRIAASWRGGLSLRVIGITGSVGKSTTKELAAEVLEQRYRTLRNPGNMNNEIGLPLTLLRLTEGHQMAVLEMGFYVPGEIGLLCEIARPQVGVVTNVSQVHMERAGSLEAIAAGKAELVKSLPPAPEGVAILNFDDPLVRSMAEQTRARVFFYGLSPEARPVGGGSRRARPGRCPLLPALRARGGLPACSSARASFGPHRHARGSRRLDRGIELGRDRQRAADVAESIALGGGSRAARFDDPG